ncbi:MAG: tetratricopeptide repeat protein [Candidatus Omnitrophota bacterium]
MIKKPLIIFSILLLIPFSTFGRDILKEQSVSYREEGYRLQTAGNLRQALSYYLKAAEIDPEYLEVYNDLGVIYEAMGENDKALTMYKKALQIDPGYLPTYTNLAFFYEKTGDVLNASDYWQKRYERGRPGEYWREVSAQHLLKLGTYPKLRKAQLEREAGNLSKDLVYTREQKRLKVVDEARLHYDMGTSLFIKEDYPGALKEISTALSLNPADSELMAKLEDLYRNTNKLHIKQQALASVEEALNYIKSDNFLSAGEKLRNALSSIFRISQEQ